VYAVKKGSKHNWQGACDQATVWEIDGMNIMGRSKDEDDERQGHSTQKPIECMARPIRNNSKKGETVIDPFLGSGTTLIAAEKLKRICYGMELDPRYVDVSIERWVKSTGINSIKRNGKAFLWK
jgi:DNA modification methylase